LESTRADKSSAEAAAQKLQTSQLATHQAMLMLQTGMADLVTVNSRQVMALEGRMHQAIEAR
jgi:hypothetical protein